MTKDEIDLFKKSFRKSKNGIRSKTDWQKQRVYSFESAYLNSPIISREKINTLNNRLKRFWGIDSILLFPEFHEDEITAWPLTKTSGAIQISPYWFKEYCIAHEFSHLIVECAKLHNNFKKLRDKGHGPFFTSVYCINLEICGVGKREKHFNNMVNYGIRVMDLNDALLIKNHYESLAIPL